MTSPVLKRIHSSPFLRKPVPPPQLDDPTTSAAAHSSPSIATLERRSSSGEGSDPLGASSGSTRRRTSTRQTYNAIDKEDRVPEHISSLEIESFEEPSSLERHLNLIDLIAVGVGGTIGSGLFVLAGLVAHEYAGPSTVVSWAISGVTACLSGCCYAELSARIPLAGSTYAYSYVAMGELPAMLAAACLSLEYIAASAAVARSWGDKCILWLEEELGDSHWIHDFLGLKGSFSIMAFFISSATVLLLLNGVKESKRATNIFTLLKVSVVLFMIIVGFVYVRPANWTPFIPPQFGVGGIFRGATGTFFGYLGYDQLCCLAGEAINPKRNLPIAILLTLVGVSILYMIATLALTGMQPFEEISPVSGFPAAFYALNANIAGQITSAGEIITLPIVVLITTMSQPRLQYAMAEDGLLPPFFRRLDANGNLWNGTLFAGTLMVLVATFVPFTHLNDVISCAVLSALIMTDTSLILLWHEAPDPDSSLGTRFVLAFHVGAVITSVSITRFIDTVPGFLASIVGAGVMILSTYAIYFHCPRSDVFGGHRRHYHQDDLRVDDGYFKTPFVPLLPCVAIFINWYLIAQLELLGVIGLIGFMILTIVYYFAYAMKHSVGNDTGWERAPTHSEEAIAGISSAEMPQLSRSGSLTEIN